MGWSFHLAPGRSRARSAGHETGRRQSDADLTISRSLITLQLNREVCELAPDRQSIENLATELGRVNPRHVDLSSGISDATVSDTLTRIAPGHIRAWGEQFDDE